jgi:phosphatidate phosphatase PAH1
MENNMTTLDMVNAAISGDKEAFQAAFDATFANKVTDALEVKKVEIASSLITPEVETNEVETDQVEVDGGESSDGSAEVAADETSST